MLDGTTNEADARLIADIMAAPDQFDGGCAADTERHSGVADFEMLSRIKDTKNQSHVVTGGYINRAYRTGRELGLLDAREWLRNNGYTAAASAMFMQHESIVAAFD